MKKKSGCVLGLVLVVLVFAGCVGQQATRVYTNALYSFSLDPPEGWNISENESAEVAVRFVALNSSNVSLMITPPFILSEGLSLSIFADQVEENLSASGMNYTIVYREWRARASGSAYEIAYSYEINGLVQRFKQVAVLRSRTVFLILFSAPAPLYIKYLESVDKSIDSFV